MDKRYSIGEFICDGEIVPFQRDIWISEIEPIEFLDQPHSRMVENVLVTRTARLRVN